MATTSRRRDHPVLRSIAAKATLYRLDQSPIASAATAPGSDAVRRYARNWQRQETAMSSGAYVPLIFAPGEAYQFDWSHEVVVINGVTMIVKVAHVRLCHSRMLFARAYPRETQERVIEDLIRFSPAGFMAIEENGARRTAQKKSVGSPQQPDDRT